MVPDRRLAIAAFVFVAIGLAGAEGGAPVLEATDLVYDAGKVSRGTAVTHTFVLKNAGGSDLSVDAKPG